MLVEHFLKITVYLSSITNSHSHHRHVETIIVCTFQYAQCEKSINQHLQVSLVHHALFAGTLPWDGDQGPGSPSPGRMGAQADNLCAKRCLDTPTRKLRVPQAHSPESPSDVRIQCLTAMLGAATSPAVDMAACLRLSEGMVFGETSHAHCSPETCMHKTVSQQVLSPQELCIIAAGHEKAWDRWKRGKLLPV